MHESTKRQRRHLSAEQKVAIIRQHLIDDPGFIHDFQKTLHDHCLRELELFAEYSVEVVGIGHDLNPTIPLENFYAMRDAVCEFRFVADLP